MKQTRNIFLIFLGIFWKNTKKFGSSLFFSYLYQNALQYGITRKKFTFNIENSGTYPDLLAVVDAILLELQEIILKSRNNNLSPIIKRIIEHINQNYQDNISLGSVAAQLGFRTLRIINTWWWINMENEIRNC